MEKINLEDKERIDEIGFGDLKIRYSDIGRYKKLSKKSRKRVTKLTDFPNISYL